MCQSVKPYVIVFSPTAGEACCYDRNYHFIGRRSELWAKIRVADLVQMEKGICGVVDIPEDFERMLTDGHVMFTCWTNYYN